MDVLALAREIISGRRLGRQDDLSFFLTCDLDQLCQGADQIRAACVGDKVDLCSIINGRSGRCPEDCKYCAQSAHNHTDCEVYDFLPQEEILRVCKLNEQEGVDRFSIVTAGRALTGAEFDRAIQAYETMHRACKIDLCASMGFLNEEQLHRLHQAGVTSYHHNIETSRRNFPNICTTHTYDMKVETLKKVKAEGMCACSGGIIGMGETWEDRLDMAVSLAELGIDSIPINALMPIPGTPLEHMPRLTEDEILTQGSMARVNPPLRTSQDVKGILAGLKDGTIDVIATDHAPHSAEEKARPLTKAPSGMVGLETSLALTLTGLYHTGKMELPDIIRRMSTNPADILHLPKGRMSLGVAADLTIFDPDQEWTIDPEQFASKGRNTPFAGKTVKGRVKYTIVDGQIVYQDT